MTRTFCFCITKHASSSKNEFGSSEVMDAWAPRYVRAVHGDPDSALARSAGTASARSSRHHGLKELERVRSRGTKTTGLMQNKIYDTPDGEGREGVDAMGWVSEHFQAQAVAGNMITQQDFPSLACHGEGGAYQGSGTGVGQRVVTFSRLFSGRCQGFDFEEQGEGRA